MNRPVFEDDITPEHVEIVRLPAPAKYDLELEVKARKEALGTRYLCHEANRVYRLDGKVSLQGMLVDRREV